LFDNEYSVLNSWLGFGVVEECPPLPLIPHGTAGSFAKSKDCFSMAAICGFLQF